MASYRPPRLLASRGRGRSGRAPASPPNWSKEYATTRSDTTCALSKNKIGTRETTSVIRYWSNSAQHCVRATPRRSRQASMRSSTLGTEVTEYPHSRSWPGVAPSSEVFRPTPRPPSCRTAAEPAAAVGVVLTPRVRDAHRDLCAGVVDRAVENRSSPDPRRTRSPGRIQLQLDPDLGQVVSDRPRLIGEHPFIHDERLGRSGMPPRRNGRRLFDRTRRLASPPGPPRGRRGTGRTRAGAFPRRRRAPCASRPRPSCDRTDRRAARESSSTSAALSIARATARRTWTSSNGGTARFIVTE